MARIGIFGGSFNPPHNGHISAANNAVSMLKLDRLLLIPTATPPHKQMSADAPSAEHRLAMLKLAAKQIADAEVCDLEILRGGTSYSVDTLRILRAQYPNDELFFIMGTDMLLSFRQWHLPEQVVKLAQIVCLHRQQPNDKLCEAMAQEKTWIEENGGKCILCENPVVELSSTMVRRMLFFGCAQPYLPQSILDYILERGLYCTKDSVKGLPFDALKEYSLRLHDEKRVPHAIGTSQYCKELALQFGADPVQAERAGILHDVTKALKPAQHFALCEHLHVDISPEQRDNPKLLHALTGAAVAEHIFGECDAVVAAIRSHTTGTGQMSTLQKILYIADYAEPNRDFPGVEYLRGALEHSLEQAVLMGLEMTMQQLREKNAVICRDTLAAYESLTKERNGDSAIHETLW